MSLDSGRLRHRINIQRMTRTQVAETGEMVTTWVPFLSNEPAAIEPLSVREFIASQSMQSSVTARIVIRYHEGLTADMRIVHGSKIYNPQGWLPDPDSGIEFVTAACSEGLNEG